MNSNWIWKSRNPHHLKCGRYSPKNDGRYEPHNNEFDQHAAIGTLPMRTLIWFDIHSGLPHLIMWHRCIWWPNCPADISLDPVAVKHPKALVNRSDPDSVPATSLWDICRQSSSAWHLSASDFRIGHTNARSIHMPPPAGTILGSMDSVTLATYKAARHNIHQATASASRTPRRTVPHMK